ncbi:MAG: hypothetical protein MRK01_05635 [Candidatus Scalindua sp.]|nr:hypothetical protein [Candidatus Scalindua sp.]
MKKYRHSIILFIILFGCSQGSKADTIDDFIMNINPELKREEAIRFAMEKTFEMQSQNTLKRILTLFSNSAADIKIVAESIGLRQEMSDTIIHALGYIFAKDIVSEGIYGIEEIREYTAQIDADRQSFREIIEGMKLEIELRRRRERSKIIRELINAGFPPNIAEKAAELEEKDNLPAKTDD